MCYLSGNQQDAAMVNQIFVYGSLRRGFGSPAYTYISQYFDLVDQASIRGTLYDLGEYPAARPTADNRWIVGELYRIRNEEEWEWAIAQLDDYEGVDGSFDEPAQYVRELTTVTLPDESTQQAWVYWYCCDITGKPLVESGDVLQYHAARLQRDQ